jgi:hypothetical protein
MSNTFVNLRCKIEDKTWEIWHISGKR